MTAYTSEEVTEAENPVYLTPFLWNGSQRWTKGKILQRPQMISIGKCGKTKVVDDSIICFLHFSLCLLCLYYDSYHFVRTTLSYWYHEDFV